MNPAPPVTVGSFGRRKKRSADLVPVLCRTSGGMTLARRTAQEQTARTAYPCAGEAHRAHHPCRGVRRRRSSCCRPRADSLSASNSGGRPVLGVQLARQRQPLGCTVVGASAEPCQRGAALSRAAFRRDVVHRPSRSQWSSCELHLALRVHEGPLVVWEAASWGRRQPRNAAGCCRDKRGAPYSHAHTRQGLHLGLPRLERLPRHHRRG